MNSWSHRSPRRVAPPPTARRSACRIPGAAAAHGEATDDEFGPVDIILLRSAAQGLEKVHLAGELVRAAVASIEVQHESAGRRVFPFTGQALVQEVEFAHVSPRPWHQKSRRRGVVLPGFNRRG